MLKSKPYYLLGISLVLLLAAVILSIGFVNRQQPEEANVREIQNNLASEITSLQKQVVPILEILERDENIEFSDVQPTPYAFYIFKNGRMVYWSDYRFVPDYRYLKGDYTLKLIRTLRKDFLSRRWAINNSDFEVFGIIPLHNDYKIDNNYVQSGYNRSIFPAQDLTIYDLKHKEGSEVCINGTECLFKVEFHEGHVQKNLAVNMATLVLYCFGGILLLVFVISRARRMAKGNIEYSLLFVGGSLLTIRLLMLIFNFPDALVQTSLFDSRHFASSSFNPSFGDLFLNISCLLVVSVLLFRHYHRSLFVRYILQAPEIVRRITAIVLGGLLFLTFHYQYLIFQTIYHNSQITYDINQTIRFDGNRVMGFVIFITNTAIAFLLFHVLFRLLQVISKGKRFAIYNVFAGMLAFGVVNWLIGQQFLPAVIVATLFFAILIITRLPKYISRLRYNTFLYLFSGILASSLIGTIAIYEFEHEREHDRKLKFANQFLIENDNLAEFLLSEANDKIREDVFIQSRMSSPFLSKDIVRSKIRQVYLSNYFDKYDVQIYLYNANGQPFESSSGSLMPSEIKKFNVEEYKTPYDGIYFINRLGLKASKRYLDFIEVKKRGILVGYVILDLNLKRIIPDNVYPELLVDNRFLFPYQNSNYSYAVFIDGDINYHSGDYNYIVDFNKEYLTIPQLFGGGIKAAGYRHLAVKDQKGRIVVISSNNHPYSDLVSNFSFLFLIQVFIILLMAGGYAFYFNFQNTSLNYSAKIQLYLNVAFFLPLFAVSITTLSLINSSFKKEVNEEYYRKAESISNNIGDDLDQFMRSVDVDREDLPNQLSEVSKFAGVDVNLFSIRGKLLASSQPMIYENNLLSRFVNPVAYAKIKEQGHNAYVTRESVGKLQYNTTFYGVKSFDTGELIGMVSIPFFQSEYALEQNQIEVLTNVINIFTIIFIVFLMISYLAAKWLTFPLVFITQKLKKTTLTAFNEPLVWHADDEIGLMVGEYNRMLVKLEESKKALARSEKESAWREIAQQVAHEIKNPLTPMKLTLQHLSRRLKGKHDDDELEKPINSLLQQVDTLNDIASSFSSFAKMPIPEHEPYEFSAVLKNTINLHRSTENVTIRLNMPDYPVYTIGDEQLMGRIISNIIINAIQAKEGEVLTIEVILSEMKTMKLLLEIKDNGPGIDESIYSKIFIPNFSTKETGSGIGLAIAKHGVEHAGGKIWFETELEKGTSFFIELPTVS
ncbi:HAMP domain-containing histidine kinase [Fulvivirga ulvae]|uniref:sensor histidine kinase n=1 Tax=Fulvivirga ulvae TaxID=2904245 RepID=UPI001F1BC8FB|nr:HAMP domain-containing sensor histidine kinase [Fulvivirga ulvae]UII32038.1 HAMP domain-containing histidine kinase [Fulvivirga ulvae]